MLSTVCPKPPKCCLIMQYPEGGTECTVYCDASICLISAGRLHRCFRHYLWCPIIPWVQFGDWKNTNAVWWNKVFSIILFLQSNKHCRQLLCYLLMLTVVLEYILKRYFCNGKARFSAAITSVFSFTWHFENDSNMLIRCSKKKLYILKTGLLKHILFRILWWIENSKQQHLFNIEIWVTLYFKVSLQRVLTKIIIIMQNYMHKYP